MEGSHMRSAALPLCGERESSGKRISAQDDLAAFVAHQTDQVVVKDEDIEARGQHFKDRCVEVRVMFGRHEKVPV
jgi:hypothetical protein